MNQAKQHLIVALDYQTLDEAKQLINLLGDEVLIYKVGLELFLNTQGAILDYLASQNKQVFLDLKFHDIPNTTAMASLFASKKNILMFNLHISGGVKMIEACVNILKTTNSSSKLIGVTVLTSMNDEDIKSLFHTTLTTKELVLNLAQLGYQAGLDGVVCSSQEAKQIKNTCDKNFITVCPGIRPSWADTNDQQRIMTPYEAMQNGCDYIVVGRPITKTQNPLMATQKILQEMEEGLN